MSKSEHQEQDEPEEDAFEDDLEDDEERLPYEDDEDDDPTLSGDDGEPAAAAVAPEPEYEEVEADSDHRVARLRKLRSQFVTDGGELSLPSGMLTMEDSGPSMIVCPNCSSEEVRGQRFCTQCNARLPNIVVVEQKYNPGSIDGAARKYQDAIKKFHSETWSLDEFVEFLTKGLEKVRAHTEHLAEISADGVISEWLPEASRLIVNATQLWYDSVESMLLRVMDCQDEYEEEEAMLEELDEEEIAEREPLLPLEDRVRMIDFTPELESIFRSNDQMLDYLRILDSSLKTEAKVGGMQF